MDECELEDHSRDKGSVNNKTNKKHKTERNSDEKWKTRSLEKCYQQVFTKHLLFKCLCPPPGNQCMGLEHSAYPQRAYNDFEETRFIHL